MSQISLIYFAGVEARLFWSCDFTPLFCIGYCWILAEALAQIFPHAEQKNVTHLLEICQSPELQVWEQMISQLFWVKTFVLAFEVIVEKKKLWRSYLSLGQDK